MDGLSERATWEVCDWILEAEARGRINARRIILGFQRWVLVKELVIDTMLTVGKRRLRSVCGYCAIRFSMMM